MCLTQTLVVSRVTPKTYRHLQLPPDLVAEGKQLPALNQDLYVSNIYSVNERILLIWLNFFYEHYRTRIWSNTSKMQGLAPKGKGMPFHSFRSYNCIINFFKGKVVK